MKDKDKDNSSKKTRDRIIIIIIIIIIILLLLHSCCPGRKHGGKGTTTTTKTAQIIDITTNDKTKRTTTESSTTETVSHDIDDTTSTTTEDILDTTSTTVTTSKKKTKKTTKKTTKKSTSKTTSETTTVKLDVYDETHNSTTWNGSADLDIFNATSTSYAGTVAPESYGSYQFIIRNQTSYNFKYSVTFVETNPMNMNIMYKLKKNGSYIVDHYVYYDELDLNNILINKNKLDTYDLEWKWVSADNDTEVGKAGIDYKLKIDIKAESV